MNNTYDANIGDIIRFDYPQGNEHSSNVVGKVMNVRDIICDPLSSKTGNRNGIRRSQYLLTVALPYKKGEKPVFRSFYHKQMVKPRHLTKVERMLYWLRGQKFPGFTKVKNEGFH